MLVGLSSGMLAYGMRTVGTGTAAVMVATVPLFATVIAAVAGRKIGRGEWFAVGLGLVGIAILSHGGGAPGSAGGSLAILCGALFWAGGAHLAGRLKLPSDLFLSTSLQIGLGGAMSTLVAWVSGERMMEVHFLPVLAFIYLMLVGHHGRLCRVWLSDPAYEPDHRQQLHVRESGGGGGARRAVARRAGDAARR